MSGDVFVLGYWLFLPLFYGLLELFWQCLIFHCDFGTVLTVSYFSLWFWNCSDSVLFSGFLCFIIILLNDYLWLYLWLPIVLSVPLRYTVSDCPFGIFKLFLYVSHLSKVFGNVKNPYIINQNHIFSRNYNEVISG
jgi:hypothetical protein